jgi:UDP-N-acetylglucosamine 4,6-dehydratase
MIPAEDSRNVVITETGYIILPETGVFNYKGDASALQRVPEGFAYSSDTNDRWISVEELRTILTQQGFTL